jgi:hypothetical protein
LYKVNNSGFPSQFDFEAFEQFSYDPRNLRRIRILPNTSLVAFVALSLRIFIVFKVAVATAHWASARYSDWR